MSKKQRSISREEMMARYRKQDLHASAEELNEFSRRALSGLQYMPEGQDLEDRLSRIDARIREKAGGNRRASLVQRMSIAAAAAVLLFAVYFAFFQPPDKEALFAHHFEYLPGSFQDRAGNEASSSTERAAPLYQQAVQAYESENYKAALAFAEDYMEQAPGDTKLGLYYGILLLGEGKGETAIPYLKATAENPPSYAFERPARWYLGLAYLRTGREVEAERIFRELSGGTDRYATNARALLKEWQK